MVFMISGLFWFDTACYCYSTRVQLLHPGAEFKVQRDEMVCSVHFGHFGEPYLKIWMKRWSKCVTMVSSLLNLQQFAKHINVRVENWEVAVSKDALFRVGPCWTCFDFVTPVNEIPYINLHLRRAKQPTWKLRMTQSLHPILAEHPAWHSGQQTCPPT